MADEKEFSLKILSRGNWNLRKIMPKVLFLSLSISPGVYTFTIKSQLQAQNADLKAQITQLQAEGAECRRDLDFLIRKESKREGIPAKPPSKFWQSQSTMPIKPSHQDKRKPEPSPTPSANAILRPSQK